MKNRKYIWIAGAFCLFPLAAGAQSYSSRLFDDGKALFLRHDYAAAQQTLIKYIGENPEPSAVEEATYMIVCTAYELNDPQRIRRLNEYIGEFPDSRYVNRVKALLASAYFSEKRYDDAINCYEQTRVELLPDAERDEALLQLGVSNLKTDRLRSAAIWLNMLKTISSTRKADATYYLAYIAYSEGRYDEALKDFQSSASNKKYASLAPYYIADIFLIKGRYDQAESVASSYLKTNPSQEKSVEMKRIRGEALYGMQRYADAISALEGYKSSAGSHANRNAMYKLGMSYYYTNVYSKAALALSEVEQPRDAVAQNAYLHQGLAYLQLKDRTRARMAFEQASSMDGNREVKEQALYNYALCLHETSYSPFAESVTVFERFLNEYPNSIYAEKVNDYLVEVYMNTRNYEVALRSIDKISHPGSRILEAKQKLLFRMGTQSVAQARFDEAINYFNRSIQLGKYNVQTHADAYYWRGESNYRLENYAGAASDFRRYITLAPYKSGEEYGLALYNLGYTSFKQKDYDGALGWFSKFMEQSVDQNRSVVADTYNRMGDCHFHSRRFDTARNLYERASLADPSLGDYSLFQEGFVEGLQRDYKGKIQTLNKLLTDYPSSQYVDDALYEQGRAFIQLEDNSSAIDRYELLVNRFPDSPLSRKAANEIGLLYYQDDRTSEAIAAYKKVITQYPGSEESRVAQRDLKSIYVDLNKVDDYLAFASSLPGGANFDVNERDSLTYTAAERAYLRAGNNSAQARAGFEQYLQSFPQGAFSVDAHFYAGLIDYRNKDYDNAVTHLRMVAEYPTSKYAAEAMKITAEIAYDKKDYAEAQKLYQQLADHAAAPEEKQTALLGTLRSAWLNADKNAVLSSASALLSQNKLVPEILNEARYYRAKVLLERKNWNDAAADLRELSGDTRNVYGAEAKYLLAQLYFDLGETAKAENEILDYIDVSTPHAYWLARSFVLLSDVYVKMGRNLDAKQYLLSLKQNYQADDDIAGMIENRLNQLKK